MLLGIPEGNPLALGSQGNTALNSCNGTGLCVWYNAATSEALQLWDYPEECCLAAGEPSFRIGLPPYPMTKTCFLNA
jgi:hypothetical protein